MQQPDEGGDSKPSATTDGGGDSKSSTVTEGGDSKPSTTTEGGDSKSSTASGGGDSNPSVTTDGGGSKSSTATGGGDSMSNATTEAGDSKSSSTTHDKKMPPDRDIDVADSGPLNKMPPDGYLLAEKPGAGGAPRDGAILERLANKDQVNITEEGDTLDCGHDMKVSFAEALGWLPTYPGAVLTTPHPLPYPLPYPLTHILPHLLPHLPPHPP